MSHFYPCVVCGNEASLICPCENRTYCTRDCQVYDWGKTHFRVCSVRTTTRSREASDSPIDTSAQTKSRPPLNKTPFNKQGFSKIKDFRRASTAPYVPSDYSAFAQRPKDARMRNHMYVASGYGRGPSEPLDSQSGPLYEFADMTLEARRRASEHHVPSPNANEVSENELRRGPLSAAKLTAAAMHRSDSRSGSYDSSNGSETNKQSGSDTADTFAKANAMHNKRANSYENHAAPGAQHESKNRTVRSYSYYGTKGANAPLYRRDSAFSSTSDKNPEHPQRSQSAMSSHSIDSLIGKSDDTTKYDGGNFQALPEEQLRPRSAGPLSRSVTYTSVPRAPHQLRKPRSYSTQLSMTKRDSGVSLDNEEDTHMSDTRSQAPPSAEGAKNGARTMPRDYENLCVITRRHTEPAQVSSERSKYAPASSIAESEAQSEDDEDIEVELLDESRPKTTNPSYQHNSKTGVPAEKPGLEPISRIATTGVDSPDNRLYLDPLSRRYPCQWQGCNKRFVRRGHMQSHMRTHTGEKPFACTWQGCKSRFGQMGDLGRHMITHTGERPYPCTWPHCDKRFTTNQSKNRHYRIHTNTKKLHHCEWQQCDAHFTTKHGLKMHQRTHTCGPAILIQTNDLLEVVHTESSQTANDAASGVEAAARESRQRPMVST